MQRSIRKRLALLISVVIIASSMQSVVAQEGQVKDKEKNIISEITTGRENTTTPGAINLFGIIDFRPPELISIEINKEEIEAPGTIEVEVIGLDDISGVSSGRLVFEEAITNKSISIYLDGDRVWNEETKRHEPLAEGVLKGNKTLDQYQFPGEYELVRAEISDRAKNNQYYIKNPSERELQNGYKALVIEKKIKVINKSTIDTKPPELISIEMNKEEIEVPGTIEVEVIGLDDISGVSSGRLVFEEAITNKSISIYLDGDRVWNEETKRHEPLAEGVLKGNKTLDQYQFPGEYELVRAEISDRAKNNQCYIKNPSERELQNGYKALVIEKKIKVINKSTIDTKPPELISIEMNKEEIEAPGTIEVEVIGLDDISGVSSGRLVFEEAITNKSISIYLDGDRVWNEETKRHEPLAEGVLKGNKTLDQYQFPGEYELVRAEISDRAKNNQWYIKNPSERELQNGYKALVIEKKIKVINEGAGFDFTTNTSNPNLAEDIKNIQVPSENEPPAKIGINYETGSKLSGNVFKSIAGENKEIILEGGEIQWVFNGKDIDSKNIKDIDLNVSISDFNQFNGNNASNIKEIVKDKPTYVLSFPNNGQLPGKATIRLKVDFAFIEHLGKKDLCIYYFDARKGELVSIKNNVNVSYDGYVEFEIYHNSDFLVTKGEVKDSSSGGSSSGGSNSSGGSSSTSKPPSTEQVIEKLPKKDKEAIINNFKEEMPYTSLTAELTLEQLKKLTNNKFTDKQLQEMLDKPELLEKLGIDKSMLSGHIVLKPVENVTFTDVPKRHWASGSIKLAAELGLVAGMPDGTFTPSASLQVADTFTFLDRVLLLNGITEMKLPRSTVEKYITNKEHWSFANVASIGSKLSEDTLKIVSNLEKQPITRGLLAQVLYEITDSKIEETRESIIFTDTQESPYKKGIDYCVKTGLLVGTSENTISPEKILTRAELMAILIRLNEFLK